MLTQYTQTTQLLLHDPKMERFNPFDLRSYVNTARGQVALDGECIRNYATLDVTNVRQQYAFSEIDLSVGTVGVAGVMNVRMATFQIAGGSYRMTSREWPYFNDFVLNNAAPVPGLPTIWTQYGQGASGSIFVNSLDQPYTLNLDTVCFPEALTSDAAPEAIPYAWTDAVPYFAAYMALLTAQQADAADGMFKLYQMFVSRARQFATPSVLPMQYEQTPDPMMANRLGVTMQRGAA